MAFENENLLNDINYPSDLRKLQEKDLVQVSQELRQFIIDEVSTNPGHFGASLGVVELAVALHYVYNTPYDQIVWDVGHQAYAHKILTGRRKDFHTNRLYGGLSGFPKRAESEYDVFGVGHSSTSISAGLGLATAAKQLNEDRNVVAVIGDGSLTGGMAFEGLNNAGTSNTNILVIVNDNNMSIDPNVGALNEYLLDLTTSKTYNKMRNEIWRILGKIDSFGHKTQQLIQKVETGIKTIVQKHSNLFEALNFRYFGPVDGHDVMYLSRLLKDLKELPGPKVLHIVTKKGKGFRPAELSQTEWHAPGRFNKNTGEIIEQKSTVPKPPKFQDVFGYSLLELAKLNPKIVGVTPAMPSGCSMTFLMQEMPERAFDVGIAEQHAVTFSAGMAANGLIPFCNIYSSFMQRAYDQVIHDVALQKLHVVLCLDRGGLVGADGATHHGAYDIAYMRIIPNLIVCSPYNEVELRNLMYTAQLKDNGPVVIRYPRGAGSMVDWQHPFEEITIGTGRKLKDGADMALVSFGPIGTSVAKAAEILADQGIDAAHYDLRFAKPLDHKMLHELFQQFKKVITIEDGTIVGGIGSALIEFANEHGYSAQIKRMGIPDQFIEHGTPQELITECGFHTEGIVQQALEMTSKNISAKKA